MEKPPTNHHVIIDVEPVSVKTTEGAPSDFAAPADHTINPNAQVEIYTGPAQNNRNDRPSTDPFESVRNIPFDKAYRDVYNDSGVYGRPFRTSVSTAMFEAFTTPKDPVAEFGKKSITRPNLREATVAMLSALEGPAADLVRDSLHVEAPVKKEKEPLASLFTPEQHELAATVSHAIIAELDAPKQSRVLVEPNKFASAQFKATLMAKLLAGGHKVNKEAFDGVFTTLLPALKAGYDESQKPGYTSPVRKADDYALAA